MGHKHSVYDTDAHFSINPITKVIKNESSKKTTLVQGDHNSERFSFDIPRFIDGHDMMLCNLVEVHFDNKETGTGNISSDFYEVKDMQISPDDQNMVVFSWLIIDTATKYAGTLEFSIKFKCMTGDVCDYKWNTAINTDISVTAGKDNSGVVVERAPNVVDQWRNEIFGDAENAVANINLKEQEALEAVQEEGAAQVAAVKTTADGIEAERQQIHLNNALKAAAIAGSAEGEVIVLNDSAEQPFEMFHVFGKSEQFKTTGKNLLNVEKDCTFEGYLIVPANIPAGSYILSLENLVRGGQYQPYVHFVDNNVGTYLYSATKETEITLPQDETEVRIYSNNFSASGSAGVSATLQRLMLSSEGGTYEPFTGGIPAPNPEYPQEISGVENPEIRVSGKNILNLPDGEHISAGITWNCKDGVIQVSGTSTGTSSTDGTIYRLFKGLVGEFSISGSSSLVDVYVFVKKNGTSKWYENTSFVLDGTETEVKMYCQIFGEGKTVDETIHPMLAVGNEVAEWEKPNVGLLHVPYTLHAIPVTSGGNYTDVDGQKWICDEVDLERGVLVQRLGYYVFDGSDDEAWNGIYTHDSKKYVYIKVPRGSIQYTTPLFCNYAKMGAWSSNNVCFINNYAEFVVGGTALESVLTSVVAFRTHIAENPIMLVYVLETPVETALTDEEIDAFKALHSNFPNTTIMNDAGAHMAVKYGIDTKTYIDKKFAELQSALQ